MSRKTITDPLTAAQAAAHELHTRLGMLQGLRGVNLAEVEANLPAIILPVLTAYWFTEGRWSTECIPPVLETLAACRQEALEWGAYGGTPNWVSSASAGLLRSAHRIKEVILNYRVDRVFTLIEACASEDLRWPDQCPRPRAIELILVALFLPIEWRESPVEIISTDRSMTAGEACCRAAGVVGRKVYDRLRTSNAFWTTIQGSVCEGIIVRGIEWCRLLISLQQALEFDFTRASAEIDGEFARAKTKPVKPAKRPSKTEAKLDSRAVAVFLDHTDWNDNQIAQHLGSNQKSLTPKRCPKLAAARKAHREASSVPRGSKTDGRVEAQFDEED